MFERFLRPKNKEYVPLSETEEVFLREHYLKEAYTIDPVIKEKFRQIHTELKVQFPEVFISLVVVGSLVNGSYVLRRRQVNSKPADADYYLIGHATDNRSLQRISTIIKNGLEEISIPSDGYLNGSHPEIYLNVDDIDGIIERGDINLLAIAFQYTTGDVKEVQNKIIEHILKFQNSEVIWTELRTYYQQSLMMGHGSWSEDFNRRILDDFYPTKLEKFDLPDSLEEMVKKVTN